MTVAVSSKAPASVTNTATVSWRRGNQHGKRHGQGLDPDYPGGGADGDGHLAHWSRELATRRFATDRLDRHRYRGDRPLFGFFSLDGGNTYHNVGPATAASRSISWTLPAKVSATALGRIRVEACNASNSVLSQAFSTGIFFFNDILFHYGDKVEVKTSKDAIVRSITKGVAGTTSLYTEKEFLQGTVVSQAPQVACLGVGGEYYFWYEVNWGDGKQIGWTADVALGLAFVEDAKAVPVGSFNGVTAYSNGSPDNASSYPKSNIPKSKYSDGMEWQCVEYVNRYYQSKYGIDLSGAGNATSYFNYGSKKGLSPYTNDKKGNVAPQAGDILCFSGGPGEHLGHVAIVRSVDLTNGWVYVIQQNGVEDPRDADWPFKLTVTGGVYNVSADSLDPKLVGQTFGIIRPGLASRPPDARPEHLGQAALCHKRHVDQHDCDDGHRPQWRAILLPQHDHRRARQRLADQPDLQRHGAFAGHEVRL